MIELEIDAKPLAERAEQLGAAADQLPFIFMTVMNDAAFKARQVLTEVTWPSHVQVKNRQFISAALRVEKATKDNPAIRIYDVLGKANLKQHAYGGIARPIRSRQFAIPMPGFGRFSLGDASLRSPALLIEKGEPFIAGIVRKLKGKKRRKSRRKVDVLRSVRITPKGIFVGKGGRLHLAFAFKRSVTIPSQVPFDQDFRYTVTEAVRTGFDDKVVRAMQSAMLQTTRKIGRKLII
jgi:hypothetical protein